MSSAQFEQVPRLNSVGMIAPGNMSARSHNSRNLSGNQFNFGRQAATEMQKSANKYAVIESQRVYNRK